MLRKDQFHKAEMLNLQMLGSIKTQKKGDRNDSPCALMTGTDLPDKHKAFWHFAVFFMC